MQTSHLLISINIVFFFNDTATTEIYTLSLHDALPIYIARRLSPPARLPPGPTPTASFGPRSNALCRSEEHTSELQSRGHLVCRLLLEKKKKEERELRHSKNINEPVV